MSPEKADLNVDSFDALFDLEFSSIVRDAYGVLGDREGAIDVAQEAFARAYQHWNKVKKYDRPGAWVRRVAIRLAVQNRFHRFKESQVERAVADVGLTHDDRMVVRNAVLQLPRAQRAAVVLHYFHDLAIGDVAQCMGVRLNTAKAHLFKARARLRELLQGVFGNGAE